MDHVKVVWHLKLLHPLLVAQSSVGVQPVAVNVTLVRLARQPNNNQGSVGSNYPNGCAAKGTFGLRYSHDDEPGAVETAYTR